MIFYCFNLYIFYYVNYFRSLKLIDALYTLKRIIDKCLYVCLCACLCLIRSAISIARTKTSIDSERTSKFKCGSQLFGTWMLIFGSNVDSSQGKKVKIFWFFFRVKYLFWIFLIRRKRIRSLYLDPTFSSAFAGSISRQ